MPTATKTKKTEPEVSDSPAQEENLPTETEALLPEPSEPFTLSDGSVVLIKPLNLKEFLVMMRIITRGAAVAFNGGISINPDSPTFVQDFVSLFIFAVAEAEYEAAEFLRVMVYPSEDNDENNQKLDVLMSNPSLEDTLTIINYIIAKNAPNIKSLGKRLGTLTQLAQKVGAM